ncbi:MAG: hypothetical protein HYZ14_11285 [Bacteroidetes bacterium]|nr:hypothetical protein [Bacteroidota bacterium]
MILGIAIYAALQVSNPAGTQSPAEKITGQWKGIEMYQDAASYDGRTFYLPNSEELIIDKTKFKVYFYPYFKSEEFDAVITAKSIVCNIGKKKVKSDYSFIGDTLVISMNFINKNFIKMYERVTFDDAVIAELDGYGFNPSSLTNEFELDTLHPELKRGFTYFDSLGFDPIYHLRFIDDYHILVNRTEKLEVERLYQAFKYTRNGREETYRILKVQGTQQFSLIPFSYCQCDTIQIPYLVVSWADRIRQRIAEDAAY